jgi:hypothetical protein
MDEVLSIEEAPRKKKRVFKNVLVTLLYFFSICIGSLFGFFLSYMNRLPQIEQSERFRPNIPPTSTNIRAWIRGEFYAHCM